MKKLSALLLSILGFATLAGCVAYPAYGPGPGNGPHYRGGYGYGDRDGDGVPNRDDRRPNNPRRY
jgi:hypothetical protein